VAAENQAVDLTRLLRPRSVAIVGISAPSLGATVLDNLQRIGFAGDIHLVSRSNREIGGRRCVGTIDELPESIDAAVLAVPRQAVVDAVAACVRRRLALRSCSPRALPRWTRRDAPSRKRWQKSHATARWRCAVRIASASSTFPKKSR